MHQTHSIRVVVLLIVAALAAAIIAACSTETIVERTVIVERDKIVEVEVKGDDVIVEQTVIVKREFEVAVKGDDVIVEQTVIVEKEVQVKGDDVIVVATPVPEEATFFGLPFPVVPSDVGTAPAPGSPAGAVVVRGSLELRISGLPEEGGGLGQSVAEKLFMTDEGGNAVNLVADSWDLADDLSSLTVTLKKGIQWHGGNGELTAADVAWSYNRGNPGFNPESVTDGGSNWISFLGDNEGLRSTRTP